VDRQWRGVDGRDTRRKGLFEIFLEEKQVCHMLLKKMLQ
jgi:hypothetical protein